VIRSFVLLSLLCGVAYPLAVTAVAWALFPAQAGGSLVHVDGRVVGSALIGQPFEGERWFHGRPSASDYDASASGGSNLAASHPDVVARLAASSDPVDLRTTSASGLDPHVSPEAARAQVARVAAARGMRPEEVAAIVDAHVEPRTLGFLGEPRVNVLALNLALDGR
jgi:potassium-transporting ATPase KdpC subunit